MDEPLLDRTVLAQSPAGEPELEPVDPFTWCCAQHLKDEQTDTRPRNFHFGSGPLVSNKALVASADQGGAAGVGGPRRARSRGVGGHTARAR